MLANLVRLQSSLNWSSQLIVAGDRVKIKEWCQAMRKFLWNVWRLFSYQLRDTVTHYKVHMFADVHIFFHGRMEVIAKKPVWWNGLYLVIVRASNKISWIWDWIFCPPFNSMPLIGRINVKYKDKHYHQFGWSQFGSKYGRQKMERVKLGQRRESGIISKGIYSEDDVFTSRQCQQGEIQKLI